MAKEKKQDTSLFTLSESILVIGGEIRIAGRTYCSQPFA